MKYFSLDIETTGLDPQRHSILEIGVVYDDLTDPNHDIYDRRNWCSILFEPNGLVYDVDAMKMNLELINNITSLERIFRHNQKSGCNTLIRWLCEMQIKFGIKEFIFAGKNCATFDLRFIETISDGFRETISYKYVLDPSILYMKKDDVKVPNMAICSERAGVVNNKPHSAVYDAINVCELIRKGVK